MSLPSPHASDRGGRVTINQIEDEDSAHLYVKNTAPRQTGVPTHSIITHVDKQSGSPRSIELVLTWIPQDLTDFAPTDELLRNTDLRRLWRERHIEFVLAEDAERTLSTPDALAEIDRLFMDRHRSERAFRDHQDQSDSTSQQDRAAALRVAQAQAQRDSGQARPAQGQYDEAASGVSASVVQAMQGKLGDSERLALLRNLADSGILTEADRRYVRERTENPDIRRLVAGG